MQERVQQEITRWITRLEAPLVDGMMRKLATGKMLRTRLIEAIAGENNATIRLAAVVEMIHAASLLHDDVIDHADTRRGQPSINALHGDGYAVMLGDVLYSQAFAELVSLGQAVAVTVARSVTELSVGELLDVELAKRFNTDEERYLEMIGKKTASLIEASAKAAAIIAGRHPEHMALYGRYLGLAFQVVDDLLDVTQDSQTLGKPAMSDLKEGKVTLPIIRLHAALDAAGQKRLRALHRQEFGTADEQWIRTSLEATGALQASQKAAEKLARQAVDMLDSTHDTALLAMVEKMIQRVY